MSREHCVILTCYTCLVIHYGLITSAALDHIDYLYRMKWWREGNGDGRKMAAVERGVLRPTPQLFPLSNQLTRFLFGRPIAPSYTFISHVSLKGHHIVVRLPSACRSCRSCNTKTSKSRHNLYINIYLSIQYLFRSGLICK
jgi:hypothetical protein